MFLISSQSEFEDFSRDCWNNVGEILSGLREEHPNDFLDERYGFRNVGELMDYIEDNFVVNDGESYLEHPDVGSLECPDCADDAEIDDAEVDTIIYHDVEESFRHGFDEKDVFHYWGYCKTHRNNFFQYVERADSS